jgi:hypothetical protein
LWLVKNLLKPGLSCALGSRLNGLRLPSLIVLFVSLAFGRAVKVVQFVNVTVQTFELESEHIANEHLHVDLCFEQEPFDCLG